MSSGYFPLSRNEKSDGFIIERCIEDIKVIRQTLYDSSCQDNNGEDGTSDGGYLAYLSLAEELLERCLRAKTSP